MKSLKPITLTKEQRDAISVQVSKLQEQYVVDENGNWDIPATIKKLNINPLTVTQDMEEMFIAHLEKQRANAIANEHLINQQKTVVKQNQLSENREIFKTKEQLASEWHEAKAKYEDSEIEWKVKLKPLEDELNNLYYQRKLELGVLKNEIKSKKQKLSEFILNVKVKRGY